jgi:predicted amidohydrolase YtcJ
MPTNGARDGKIAQVADAIAASEANSVVDAAGKLVFPGGVDAHFHIGIYRHTGERSLSGARRFQRIELLGKCPNRGRCDSGFESGRRQLSWQARNYTADQPRL